MSRNEPYYMSDKFIERIMQEEGPLKTNYSLDNIKNVTTPTDIKDVICQADTTIDRVVASSKVALTGEPVVESSAQL